MAYNIEAQVHVFKSGGERVTSGFGPRTIFIDGAYNTHNHTGLDLISRALSADEVVACARGLVTETRNTVDGYSEAQGSGNYVRLQHSGGFITEYFHMKKGSVCVKPGQIVERGQTLGVMGATGWVTGPHLHFGVRINGTAQNPEPYLLGEKEVLAYSGGAAAAITAGRAVQLNNVPLYVSSAAIAPSNYVTGLYYLWGPEIVCGRCRITNRADRVSVIGQVTGWVGADNVMATEPETPTDSTPPQTPAAEPQEAEMPTADTTELAALRAAVAAVKAAVAAL